MLRLSIAAILAEKNRIAHPTVLLPPALAGMKILTHNVGPGNMSPLNDSCNLALISKRLPTQVRERWARRAEEIRAAGAVANFSDLVQLVKQEARFARSYYKKMYEMTEDKGRHQKAGASNQKRASANAISIQRTSNGSAEHKRRL